MRLAGKLLSFVMRLWRRRFGHMTQPSTVEAVVPETVMSPAPQQQAEGSDPGAEQAELTYAETVLADRPMAYWRLGEAEGWRARDASGHEHHGIYCPHVRLGAPGAIAGDPDRAACFDGEMSYLTLPHSLDRLRNDFTVEAWFRNANAGINHVNAQILGHTNIFNARFNFGGWKDHSWKLTKYAVEDIFMGWTVTDKAWHHAVLLFSSTDGTLLYLDGALLARHPSTADLTADRPFPTAGMGELGFHHGELDEIAVYDYLLSAERISAHYVKGIGFHTS